ncbi:MAG: DEAD/DEAH box helicase [Alphaproteobacteria bacterium]|nr:DEAD/DEAH box helicase [Alphaproteobacteria bacterium]
MLSTTLRPISVHLMILKKQSETNNMPVKQKKRSRKKSKAHQVSEAIKIPSGWNTTDEDEINRRLLRAETEPMKVINLEPDSVYFSNFTVHSSTGQSYHIEIRSLTEPLNSCSCADYETNGLGTCKHIEKVLLTLRKKGKRKYKEASAQGSAKAEIYVDPFDHQIKLKWPQEKITSLEGPRLLKDFFSASGRLISDAKTATPVILRHVNNAPEKIRQSIRLSRRIQNVLRDSHTFTHKNEAKDFFLSDVIDGKHTLDVAKLPLYDYQKQGMLHLAFLEKAILADEMGLGKTVQAVAAAELLRKTKGIRKVLVVSPTSLKAEWEEQISKFVNLPSLLIYGNRDNRLRQYQKESFFYLTNYEQVVRDREDIQRLIGPDVVILDEAQRIKNWRTKTAATIKQLTSPYAFVLTGTPIENRIDDIYSIVQFLYPKLFGPLFRFNRDFYQLDDSGKPMGYKNLHLLHERLKPVLLRRLKRDVEGQLPSRTLNTYFVEMSSEQRSRYIEYEDMVARLASIAGRRPLTEDEFKRLQRYLASMRMLCDTPYILDQDCRICPKLHELESILEELFQDTGTKIIIFSEWERMLFLVRELLDKMNVGYAWHTGSVDQKKRRDEIHRFKDQSECKLFLSTDCGAVGLNLQAANVVINLDLPWNPAKLEQRIARAWRKHQTRTVQVINLVSENTIEHRMLGVLNLKQRLSDNVLDNGSIEEMEIPSGRKALMEQLKKVMGNFFHPLVENEEENPLVLFQEEVLARLKPRLHQLESYQGKEEKQTVFAVIDGDLTHPSEQMHKIKEKIDPQNALQLEMVDRQTFETIERLCKAGILSFNQDQAKSLYQSDSFIPHKDKEKKKRLKAAQNYREPIARKERMASLLVEGEFYEEAFVPLKDAFDLSLKAFAELMGHKVDEKANISFEAIQNDFILKKGFPKDAIQLAQFLQQERPLKNKEQISHFAEQIQSITQFVEGEINKLSLGLAA